MTWVIKRLLLKLAQKGIKIDVTDVLNQQSADDVIHLLKELIM